MWVADVEGVARYGLLPNEKGTTLQVSRTWPESQGRNLALTVLYVPYSLDSGLDVEGVARCGSNYFLATLETTHGQINGFVRQLPFKCYLPAVASVGD